ncbi:MAG: EAL domain-containing protein [Methylotenera sp.]|nr:EAL domain-containing protein [Methylotenera sp.]
MTGKHTIGLRAKLLFIVALGMLLLFGYLFVIARTVLLDGYSKLENDRTLIQVSSAQHLIQEQLLQLEGIVSDWAHWNDTYQYFLEPNFSYIQSNINDDTFRHLKINAIYLVNLRGEILLKRGFDFVTGKPWQAPQSIESLMEHGRLLSDNSRESVSGLIWTADGVSMVSAFAVRQSGGVGRRLGTFIMVRQMNTAFIGHIEEVVAAKVTLSPQSSVTTNNLKFDANLFAVQAIDDLKVAGYAVMPQSLGDNPLLLTTIADRSIFAQGQTTHSFLLWTMSLIALMLAAMTWMFDRLVLLRLARMSEDVRQIEQTASVTSRLRHLAGNDELARLSQGINQMLERLEDAQYALQLEKDRAKVTLESIADAVITSNSSGYVLYMNPAAERLTGVDFSEVKSKKLQALFRLKLEDKLTVVDSAWLTDAYSVHEEVILERADGKHFVIRKSASPLYDQDGYTFGIVTVLHDVTMLRALSNQLSMQARHDALTGLVNRYEFDRQAQDAIEDARTGARVHCMAFIDLDQFKVVNDACGHVAGDVLLKQLSSQLKAKVRNSDTLARIGGDEFAVLLMGCELKHAEEIVAELLDVIGAYRFNYDGKLFKIGASIGLTEISSKGNQTLSELLSVVDSACYAAKAAGGQRVSVYRADDQEIKEYNTQLEWVSRIELGLEKQQFILYIQRMESLKPELEPHCELLIRMQSLEGGVYPPGFFLPAAERYHLMPRLDRWVVSEAFTVMARKGVTLPYVCAINLSGQTLSDPSFLDYVIAQIKLHKIDAHRVCFEITETSVIANLSNAREFMRVLREFGCSFSLDDFGSGLSSFAYLKDFDVDYLKIDGMFIKNIATNLIDRAMVESINKVGHVMGLKTIAEFAENDEIIKILTEIGVDYAQGYGVSKPELFDK